MENNQKFKKVEKFHDYFAITEKCVKEICKKYKISFRDQQDDDSSSDFWCDLIDSPVSELPWDFTPRELGELMTYYSMIQTSACSPYKVDFVIKTIQLENC
jgi:hypothetical protein